MLAERPHARSKIQSQTQSQKEAARGADGTLARLHLFIWFLRRKRGRKFSTDYLNFLTR